MKAYDAFYWYFDDFFQYLRDLPNLTTITLDCTNTWGVMFYGFVCNDDDIPFLSLKTLRIINVKPETKAGIFSLIPNLKTLELLYVKGVGVEPPNYNLYVLLYSPNPLQHLETLVVGNTNLASFNCMLGFAVSGQFPSLRNLDVVVWCLDDDAEFVFWNRFCQFLPQLNTVTIWFFGYREEGMTHTEILDGFELQTLPTTLQKFELAAVGTYKDTKPDPMITRYKYRSLLANPAVILGLNDLPIGSI